MQEPVLELAPQAREEEACEIMSLIPIRPYQFFDLVNENRPMERLAQAPIPHRRGGGGLKLLETFILIAAARFIAPAAIFEFGTYRGSTTLALALNTSPATRIFTLDLDAPLAEAHPADASLTQEHFALSALDFSGTPFESRIIRLRGDSRVFDYTPHLNSIDLVFIDGGHDLETVASDTGNAMRILARDRLSCVLWHDYGNADYPGVAKVIEDLARGANLYHVQETMLCAYFSQPVF